MKVKDFNGEDLVMCLGFNCPDSKRCCRCIVPSSFQVSGVAHISFVKITRDENLSLKHECDKFLDAPLNAFLRQTTN